MLLIFLSTPSARRATPEPLRLRLHHQISIHALREEGDRVRRRIGSVLANFYPRPPRGGRHAHSLILPSLSDFYPRPPRGGRLSQMFLQCRLRNFYPRPPRGGRPTGRKARNINKLFLSTPSARRATVTAQRRIEEVRISIHALREEGDSRLSMMRCTSLLFLSTPSARRATVQSISLVACISRFLSTPSARRATPWRKSRRPSWKYFYPRPPRGGRPTTPKTWTTWRIFLSTPSARRATSFTVIPVCAVKFLSTPSARRATSFPRPGRGGGSNFYPRPPRGGRRRSAQDGPNL